MKFVCDAGDASWFRIETLAEATFESREMKHAVERYFKDSHDRAVKAYVPPAGARLSEQNIGLKSHIERWMPIFLTLRNRDGAPLITAMLPPGGKDHPAFRPIIVGPSNADPYRDYPMAINLLGQHFRMTLDPERCYPYKR